MNNQTETNINTIKILTFLMFLMFAMTTDAVGVIIPEIIQTFGLTLTQAATFHYGTMTAIAVSAIGLGFLTDRYGRKPVILLGLGLFATSCFLFALGNSFAYFLILLLLSGTAVGIFKTAALALIGDISKSPKEHTSTMNLAEGFFGVGAIIGPALVTFLLIRGVSWTYLYVIAGLLSLILIVLAGFSKYPQHSNEKHVEINWSRTGEMLRDPYALGFSFAIALYVVVEAAIYVWMPTLLLGYQGPSVWLATYALSIFFIFRAAGRFLGAWILSYIAWQTALLYFTGIIFICYLGTSFFGVGYAVWLLPMSGLFMSIIYPTINSKGISCFPSSEHGAVAGVILFFTAAAAAIGPLIMGIVGDIFGGVEYGFVFSTCCAGILFSLSLWNYLTDPSAARLSAQ